MKTVLNKTHRPLKIRLTRGKVLHLGPGKEGRISTQDAERDSLKRLVADGQLEVVGEGAVAESGGSAVSGGRRDTKGHPASFAVKRRGDR